MKYEETARSLRNDRIQGDYHRLDLEAPLIAGGVRPGQFVHVQVPGLPHRVLRRPFSVFDAAPDAGRLSIIYKVVGEGTAQLAATAPGTKINLLGPLGNGFSLPAPGAFPVIVAGGYGCAATFLLARCSSVPFLVLIGGRSAADLLLVREYRELGCTVRVATEDGSEGRRGVVTDLLAQALDESGHPPQVYACGPNAMLGVVCRMVSSRGLDAEVSLDHAMCCGVGACYTCVVKTRADTPDGWEYVRTCLDGPVFRARETVWD